MNKLIAALRRSRYVVNLDNHEKAALKKVFSIGPEETIQAALDDSALKNLRRALVLTDKKIYWNIKSAYTELRSGETAVSTSGPGSINTADLKTVSIFTRNAGSGLAVHLIDGDKHIRFALKWFENGETVKILFYYYLSRFAEDYNPSHDDNRKKYTAFLAAHKGRSISVIPLVYDIFNYLLGGLLLAALILPRFFRGLRFIETEKILFVSIAVKLLGILFRYRKSALMNCLLITALSCFLVLPDIFPRIEKPPVWIGYTVLGVLFSVFDFDRIFKYLVIALAMVSALVLFLQLFYLGPLF
ncbi:MAG: hypothetical protein LBQ46_13495 [Treponema sp.]|nr:hypothetical protein [Treponema sp.]